MAQPLTDEVFEELKQKYGRVVRVSSPGGDLVFRAPTLPEENAFQAARYGGVAHAGIAWRNLMVTIVVYPDQPAFGQLMTQWPALNVNPVITRALQVLRGEVHDEEVKP